MFNCYFQYLLSLPASNRNYVLVLDSREEKSSWWVTKLAEQHLAVQPKKIITHEELLSITPEDKVSHIVFIDDASYSGLFFRNFLLHFRDNLLNKNNYLMNLQLHFVIPFMTITSQKRFQKFDVMIHHQETLPDFNVPGTKYLGSTATYFDHKIPVGESTISCISDGQMIDGENRGVIFVDPIEPPYKNRRC